jgi:hypothetical protein
MLFMNGDQKDLLEEIKTAHGQLSLAHITKAIAEAAESNSGMAPRNSAE